MLLYWYSGGLLDCSFFRLVPDNSNNPILLVEDRDSNRMVALLLLQKLGFGADVVCSGLEAVEAACKRNYKCILMDVQMPEFDGFDATRAIREAESNTGRHTPIIALTALAMEGDEQRCIAAGMDGYISKPYNLQTLKEVLEKYLGASSAQSPN